MVGDDGRQAGGERETCGSERALTYYAQVTLPMAKARGLLAASGEPANELHTRCPRELAGVRHRMASIRGSLQADRDWFAPGRGVPGNAPNTRAVVQVHWPCGHHTRVHRPCEHGY
jgi:hypothetical protein